MAQILPHSSTEIRLAIYVNFSNLGDTYVPGRNNFGVAWAGAAVLNIIDREIQENAIVSTGGSLANYALNVMGRVGRGNSKCVPKLITLYEQAAGDKERQRAITSAIAHLGATSPESLPFLMRSLGDRNASLTDRASAAGSIGIYGPLAATAVEPMTALLREAVAARAPLPVIRAITDGLRRLGDAAEPAIPLLLTLAEGPEGSPATEAAVEALIDLAPVASDRASRIFAALLYREERHQLETRLTLGLATFRSAGLPYTITALKGPSTLIRSKAFETLRISGPEARAVAPTLQRIVDERREGWKTAEQLLRKFR